MSLKNLDQYSEKNYVLAPVSGRVLKVQESDNTCDVFVKMKFLQNIFIYLPIHAEVKKVLLDHKKNNKNTTLVDLYSKTGRTIFLYLFKNRFLGGPKVIVQPGDRGKATACIGYTFFSKGIIFSLKDDYKLFVREGDDIIARKTIVASFKKR